MSTKAQFMYGNLVWLQLDELGSVPGEDRDSYSLHNVHVDFVTHAVSYANAPENAWSKTEGT